MLLLRILAFWSSFLKNTTDDEHQKEIRELADSKMDLSIDFKVDTYLSKHPKKSISPLRDMLRAALKERVAYPSLIDMRRAPDTVSIQVETPRGLYTFLFLSAGSIRRQQKCLLDG